MRERRHGQAARGRVQHVGCDQRVAGAPEDAKPLRFVHVGGGLPCFSQRGHGEGGGEGEGCARWWFEEDLVLCGYAAVFVSVASALADVLGVIVSIHLF